MQNRYGDLEIEQDDRAQRLDWRLQRAAQFFFAAALVAAALGAFGSGPLSNNKTANDAGTFAAEYHRTGRREAPTRITFTASRQSELHHSIQLWIDREFLHSTEIINISPPPQRAEVSADRIIYDFPLTGDAMAAVIKFEFRPQHMGLHTARIGCSESEDVLVIDQFIFP